MWLLALSPIIVIGVIVWNFSASQTSLTTSSDVVASEPATEALLAEAVKCSDDVDKENWKSALLNCTVAADKGDAFSQASLGFMYDTGKVVAEDRVEAVNWYRKAAEQGEVTGQTNLGVLYEHGEGVKKDLGEAAKWYRKAADQGDAAAQYNLGSLYDYGSGVPENASEAVKWYRLAAGQGYANAKARLKDLSAQTAQTDSWSGTYMGTLFGGATATMRVSQSSAGNLGLKLDMASPQGCSGSFDEWVAPPTGNTLMVEMPYDQDSGLQCKVSVSRIGSTLRLEEASACHQWHGFKCGFEGVLSKVEARR